MLNTTPIHRMRNVEQCLNSNQMIFLRIRKVTQLEEEGISW